MKKNAPVKVSKKKMRAGLILTDRWQGFNPYPFEEHTVEGGYSFLGTMGWFYWGLNVEILLKQPTSEAPSRVMGASIEIIPIFIPSVYH